MNVNFILSQGNDDKQLMYSKSDNIEVDIMIDNESDEIIKDLFLSLLTRYQITSMKGMDFVFDNIGELY